MSKSEKQRTNYKYCSFKIYGQPFAPEIASGSGAVLVNSRTPTHLKLNVLKIQTILMLDKVSIAKFLDFSSI